MRIKRFFPSLGRQLRNRNKRAGDRLKTRLDSLMERHSSVELLFRTGKDFAKHRMTVHAGYFAYNAILAVFALLLLLSSILGFILVHNPELHQRIMESIYSAIPDFGGALENTLNAMAASRQLVGIIGFIGLIWTGTRIIKALEIGFMDIWETEKRSYVRKKLLALLVIAIVGVLALLSVGAHLGLTELLHAATGHISTGLRVLSKALELLLRLVSSFLLLFTIYMVIPRREQVTRDVVKGAFLTALGLLVLQYAIDFYFSTLSNSTVLYGTIGAFISILLWLYLVGILIFFGAELIENISRGREGKGAGV